MKLRLILIFLLITFSCSAFSFGSSNLSFGYPEESCIKPDKPSKPYSFSSQWEVDAYNRKVDSYNSDYQRYIRCVKDYLENAANDIKTIQQRMNEAVEEAKRESF